MCVCVFFTIIYKRRVKKNFKNIYSLLDIVPILVLIYACIHNIIVTFYNTNNTCESKLLKYIFNIQKHIKDDFSINKLQQFNSNVITTII